MRFGTFHLIGSPGMVRPERRFKETLEQIALADELGFDYVWVAEHHFSNYGYSVNPLILTARACGEARRVRFSQAICVLPFWHPLRLAEDVALTDILTEGRLDVGLGRGYQPMEFRGLNLDVADNRAMFLESLALMKKAWTEDDFTFDGRFYKVPRPVTVLPKPLQRPYPPMWMATQSLESLEWAADQGVRPLLGGSLSPWEQLADWRRRYAERWVAAGHPADELRIGVQRYTLVTETEAEAREAVWQTRWQRNLAWHLRHDDERIVAGRNQPYPFAEELDDETWWDRLTYGTPDRCVEQWRRLAEMGFTDAITWFDVGGQDGEQVLRSMRLFAREVMPALAGASVGTV